MTNRENSRETERQSIRPGLNQQLVRGVRLALFTIFQPWYLPSWGDFSKRTRYSSAKLSVGRGFVALFVALGIRYGSSQSGEGQTRRFYIIERSESI